MLNEAAAPRASKQIKQIYILFVTDKKKTKCIRFIEYQINSGKNLNIMCVLDLDNKVFKSIYWIESSR